MALVKLGYRASIKMVDAGGNVAYFRPVVQGADHATALTNTQSIVTSLSALTNALIAGYDVAEVWAEDTAQYGAAGSEVENLAQIVAPLETAGKYHTFRVPAPIDALFVGTTGPDRNKVNTANAQLIAFINHFTDETAYVVPGPDAIALISDGEKVKPDSANSLPFIDSGKRIHRASRKG